MNDADVNGLRQRIQRARKAKQLSQARLAEQIGSTRQSVYEWESGRAWPRSESLLAIAQLTGCDVEWLLTGQGSAPEEAA